GTHKGWHIGQRDAIGLVHIRTGTVAASEDTVHELLNVAAIFPAISVHIAGAIAHLCDLPEAAGQFERAAAHPRCDLCVWLTDRPGEREHPTARVCRTAAVDGRPR